jgi:hypothetical protein
LLTNCFVRQCLHSLNAAFLSIEFDYFHYFFVFAANEPGYLHSTMPSFAERSLLVNRIRLFPLFLCLRSKRTWGSYPSCRRYPLWSDDR